jgi:hypothetical protein
MCTLPSDQHLLEYKDRADLTDEDRELLIEDLVSGDIYFIYIYIMVVLKECINIGLQHPQCR